MSLIGYARISTAEGRQVLDRQLDALNEAGCERVFETALPLPRPTARSWPPVWITCARAMSLSSSTSITAASGSARSIHRWTPPRPAGRAFITLRVSFRPFPPSLAPLCIEQKSKKQRVIRSSAGGSRGGLRRVSGWLRLRAEARLLLTKLRQLPPRACRYEPDTGPCGSVTKPPG